MSTPATYLKNQLSQEKNQSRYIPYAYQLDQHTIETKSGMLLQTLKITGFHAETVVDEDIFSQKELRNTLLKSISDSSIGLHVTVKRRKINEQLSGDHAEGFAYDLHQQWQEQQSKQSYYINEWYLTIFKKPPQGKVRNIMDFANSFSTSFNKEAREAYRQEQLKSLSKITQQILSTLNVYQPKRLSVVTSGNKIISEPLSFIYELINLETREIALVECDLSSYLSHKRIFFDDQSGTIALRDNTQKIIYAAILSIKDYDPETSPCMLDQLLTLHGELTISQSFLFIDRQQARAKLIDKQRQLRQSDDKIGTTSETIDDAYDDISRGSASVGTHHYTVLCQADTRDALDLLIGKVDAALNAAGIIAVREDRGVQAAFYAQLPANTAYIVRSAIISTQNFASFANFHNTYCGQRFNNYWGDPVAILETVSGAPFYFNFHVVDVGNTFMIGPMGSGKTLLELFLIGQSMRFGGHCIIFDKDRGAEIFARAMGTYGVIAPGFSTGLNPTQMEDTQANRYHLSTLIKKVVTYKGDSLSDDDELRIKNAVDAIYQLPQAERRFRHIAPMLGIRKNGSLRARFDAWVDDGDYAWVFDNDVDHLSFASPVVGFDMTHVLNDPIIQAPLFLHLFYRIEQKLDGTRMRIVVAEGWRPLQDDTFRAQIQDWSSTPRKKEALLILDTQSVDDIANSPIGSKIVQESATQIYFANPKAEKEQYCGKFGLNEKEFQLVRTLNKASHFFLVKQGKNSVVARINLQGLDDQIAVLSGRTATVKLLDQIRREVGDNPNDWLPIFYQRYRGTRQ